MSALVSIPRRSRCARLPHRATRTLRAAWLCALATLLPATAAQAQAAYTPPTFTNIAVHDPSIIRADGQHYVFGSHLSAARSPDLMRWSRVADGATASNPLFNDVTRELAETFAWAQTSTLWAPDVLRLADGRYYMFYNACKGDSPRSALGIAVASRVEGPYVNQGIVLKSGMWGLPSEDGTVYDATRHPNVVDPNVFFDATGRLWMVYGSYSGGIFVLRLDPATGRPLPGQGYGKHLMGGNHARIEGAYVLYSPLTQFYYLFTSFGGLDAAGGYHLRVARSRNPDGPYLDATGRDMATVKANPALPLFDDATIAPHAVKLIGNFRFDAALGERRLGGAGTAEPGYVSPGHNSAFVDAASGKHFVVFHTRFPGRGEEHEVRTHQLLINADGWPLITPFRYTGETATTLRAAFVAGDWRIVLHGKAISATVNTAQSISLLADGTVAGAYSGRWSLTGGHRLTLNLSGLGEVKAVALNQWDDTVQASTLALSGLAPDGSPVFARRLPTRSEAEVLAAVAAELSLGDTSAVSQALALPASGARGTTIAWRSSNPAVLSDAGAVTPPAAGQPAASVTLTATLRKGSQVLTRDFTVVVPARAADGLIAHYPFERSLAEAAGRSASGWPVGARIDAAGGNPAYVAGVAGQALWLDGSTGVRLPDGLLRSHSYSVALWVKPERLTEFTPAFFAARDGNAWVSLLPRGHGWVGNATMLWSGSAWYDAGTGLNIPAGQWSHLAFTVQQGAVRVYVNGTQRFAGTGFPNVFTSTNGPIALGVSWWDTPYQGALDELRLYGSALSAAQVQALATR
ncbi:LamG-like jellyroll fold domain-containing protein [Aquabacterium sp. OR-4]|uniref:LamG-like jellyroll fold domain-containing protein n=1 Tax=Aquabacterium sp. OR-4 TaxID=2978127 RepID=UPI0021B44991|nr:LamG-like jellyroll fold domain-containing protein [Aquabacterium sp. OR-4]MDT7836520.1 LamG-like jellyroll fold domain-containing protein [Aquabacterium sp. OR-4]